MRASASRVEREGWRRVRRPAGARYRSPGDDLRRGRRLVGVLFPRRRRDRRRPGARRGRRARQHPGRRALRRGARGDGRRRSPSATTGSRCARPRRRCARSTLDLNHIPDAAMTAAVLALFADGPCTLRNIASWRVKETDRLAAMATELRKVGATVEEGADFLRDHAAARRTLRAGAAIDTYDDHRMAMCFSLVALGRRAGADQRSGVRRQDLPGLLPRAGSPAARREPGRMTRRRPVIAIDGPSASGKGTVAQRVARALGLPLPGQRRAVPAGRAGGDARAGSTSGDEPALTALAAGAGLSASRRARSWLAGRDVTEAIRTRGLQRRVLAGGRRSRASARRLLERQRAFRRAAGPGRRRPRHGLGRVPRRAPQGVPDREPRSPRRAPI